MKQFLIVKTSSIGDVLQCFHLIDYLKRRIPGCTIDWVAEKRVAPLLKAHPRIDQVLEIDTQKWQKNSQGRLREMVVAGKQLRVKNYDTVFDLQGNIKSGVVTAIAKGRKKVGYSWRALGEKPSFFATNVHIPIDVTKPAREQYAQLVRDYFGEMDPISMQSQVTLSLKPEEECRLARLSQLGFQRPRLMICFGSNWSHKALGYTQLVELLTLIQEKIDPSFFFIYGSEEEKKMADQLEQQFAACSHAVGNLSLPLWQRFMDLVEGVITMDSAALHMCATTSTPSFSVFGPSSAQVYKPEGNRHSAFQGTCPYDVTFAKRCPQLRTCETGACLKERQSYEIFEQFQKFWEEVSKPLLALK